MVSWSSYPSSKQAKFEITICHIFTIYRQGLAILPGPRKHHPALKVLGNRMVLPGVPGNRQPCLPSGLPKKWPVPSWCCRWCRANRQSLSPIIISSCLAYGSLRTGYLLIACEPDGAGSSLREIGSLVSHQKIPQQFITAGVQIYAKEQAVLLEVPGNRQSLSRIRISISCGLPFCSLGTGLVLPGVGAKLAIRVSHHDLLLCPVLPGVPAKSPVRIPHHNLCLSPHRCKQHSYAFFSVR